MDLPAVTADHLLEGIQASDIDTNRLRMRVLTRAGQTTGRPLLLVHGNISSSLFYQRLMLALPDDILPIAPDLRGYGETQAEPIDATRGWLITSMTSSRCSMRWASTAPTPWGGRWAEA